MKGISLRFQDYQQRCVIHNRGYTIGWYVDNEIGIVGLIDSRTSHGELFYFLKKIAELFWECCFYMNISAIDYIIKYQYVYNIHNIRVKA